MRQLVVGLGLGKRRTNNILGCNQGKDCRGKNYKKYYEIAKISDNGT